MTRAVSLLLLSSLALTVPLSAQSQAPTDLFEKAPPGVEEALRLRVKAFYQTWVDGKFRSGEKYVAEDAQETYYSMPKQKYDGCEIIRLRFEQEFKQAVVTVGCKGKMAIMGQSIDSMIPFASTWAVEKDEWVWTIKPITTVETPFGIAGYNFQGPKGGASDLFGANGLPKDVNALGTAILNQVSLDKKNVELSPIKASSEVVTVKNGLSGYIDISATSSSTPHGLVLSFDKQHLAAGEAARLTISYDPAVGGRNVLPQFTVTVNVSQTNRNFPIDVTFSPVTAEALAAAEAKVAAPAPTVDTPPAAAAKPETKKPAKSKKQ